MERLFLIGGLACLGVSWIYILLLRTKLRDCMAYIQNRIDAANRDLEGPWRSPEGGYESKQAGNSRRLDREEAAVPALGKTTMEGKPKLIIGGASSPQPLHYLCSHCLQPFYLPRNRLPKEAVAELLREFREHVEREHSDLPGDSKMSTSKADKE